MRWGNINFVKSKACSYRKYIITEISKTNNNNSIKWRKCPYIVTYCLEQIVDMPSVALLSLGPFTDREKNSDRGFYWSANHKFYSRLRIRNCKSTWSADKFFRKLMLLRKNGSCLEKKYFHHSIFTKRVESC